ncbi:hypothetical protein F2P81_019123 [Scophthalmus maximus]|uniref:Cation/H+ exchanger transmembrane domain-containing protein n=1 Tax=Scophthalmus maximus TaxID=52904 RepID=A0A6A4RYT4_SCOMX|nr:hypothetical protein F2P81_019123 [Scophthalmus maximus]
MSDALKMSDSVSLSHDSGALLALAAVSLGLITILSVWKLKQFKYGIVTETGGALFYGMLLGLTVRCLPFARVVHMETVESVCSCDALNSPPQILMVNVTSHGHCYRHVGKLDQRCPPTSALRTETFDPEVLFNLFLPPIIFHGAYTLNQKRLIDNMGPVLTFAFLGTIISCMAIGACVYGFTRLMVILGRAAEGDFFFTDCLLFGAIMSATDPVSVLRLLSDLRVDLDLHTLLFGESVLNDAVAIALTHPLLETSVFVLLSWSSFLSAEVAGLSGFRGAVALSLAIRDTSTEVRRTILTTTLLLVSFTVWVLGTAADPVLRCLDISNCFAIKANEKEKSDLENRSTASPQSSIFFKLSSDFRRSVGNKSPTRTNNIVGPLLTSPVAFAFVLTHERDGVGVDPDPDEDLSFEDEEQLHGTEPDDSNFNLEKTENQLVSIGGDTGCEHQEDLVEGDLGLGTAPAPTREA